jgi:anaphase-promoting complex subunit 6
LYKLGGELFKLCPSTSPLPFLAVGALYLVNARQKGKSAIENARKYFCKATLLSKTCHWAWEGFALTFSLSFDHDQAIAAYSTLAKLVPASAEPFVCIGMEYARSENALLAFKYFDKALLMQPEPDQLPLLFNEIGALHFKEAKYFEARELFQRAIHAANEAFAGESGEFAGVLHLNLGYALGMVGDWEFAAREFDQSSAIWPCREACYAQAVARALQVGDREGEALESALEILVSLVQPEEGDSIGEFFDFALSESKQY